MAPAAELCPPGASCGHWARSKHETERPRVRSVIAYVLSDCDDPSLSVWCCCVFLYLVGGTKVSLVLFNRLVSSHEVLRIYGLVKSQHRQGLGQADEACQGQVSVWIRSVTAMDARIGLPQIRKQDPLQPTRTECRQIERVSLGRYINCP